ncbi:hypothetical protein RBS60_07135 [Sinomonas sp. ASV486]|uniref:hypothetical protein n=1 Tax=Sinomonas sp. ASV486 TaxID=3051170 RepID=UPI0027DB2AF8|nr:hypothetical protein [Sinomonas sp. ASV486]MDQ4489971.1 hypothetical protein [Sinomonas sp. ASV486]
MAVLVRTSWLSRTAAVAALAALALFAAVFVPAWEPAKSPLFNAAFVAVTAALVLFAAGSAQDRGDRLVLRPQTRLGWWAVGLVVGAAVLFGAAGALSVFIPVASSGLSGVLGVALAGGGIAALVAWFKHHERSWLVLLMTVPAMLVPYIAVAVMVFPY